MTPPWNPPDGYLDAAGGQPLNPASLRAMLAGIEAGWADPSGLHGFGGGAGIMLDAARSSLAASLSSIVGTSIAADEVFLTHGLRTAQQLALGGITGPIVIGSVEAAHLLDLAEARHGTSVIPVDSTGRVDVDAFSRAIDHARVAVIQGANPEVGTRQPIDAIAAACRHSKVPVLMDATQMIGRGPVPSTWSLLTASARDWAGPDGLAVLIVRRGTNWLPPDSIIRGWLGGAPNIPAAVCGATALETLIPWQKEQSHTAHQFIDLIRARITESMVDVQVLGDPESRLPHILTFSVLYASGESLVTALAKQGVSVASGSACVSASDRPSHVLAAMGAFTGGNVRISLPFGCSDQTVKHLLSVLPEAVNSVRGDVW